MALHEADHYAAALISPDVLRSYVHCRYKAYLKLSSQVGVQCAYDAALAELRAEAKKGAIGKLEAAGSPIPASVKLTQPTLCLGHSAIIDGELTVDGINVRVDGLRKVAGRSQLGDFHYEPLLFHEGPGAREPQRVLLSVIALLVSRLQGRVPDRGVIYQSGNAATSTVRMPGRIKSAKSILDDLNRMRSGELRPKLVLNNHCGVCEFQQRCHLQAVREDNLSLLRGVSETDIRRHGRRGVLTLTQLAYTFRPRRETKSPEQRKVRRYHALQALAIRDQRLYVFGTPVVPFTRVRIFLDLEGNPHEGCVYLIGMIVREGDQEIAHTLWADSATEESNIFEKFLAVVDRYENPTIYCYGQYERAFIRRMRAKVRRKKLVDKILGSLVNILSLIYAHFYFPTYSNGLKAIGRYLGCIWTAPDASAAQSIAWRVWWARTRDDAWKAKLVAYNLEDCTALRKVVDVLQKVSADMVTSLGNAEPESNVLPVSRVRDLETLAHPRNWNANRFVDPDYRFVNDRSYFDYQRQRIFVRTSKRLKKQVKKRRPQQNRHLRGRIVEIDTDKCSKCGSSNLIKIDPIDGRAKKSKRTFDLLLSGGAIGRQVVDYRAVLYRCVACGAHLRAEQYERVAKYRHGLMSWAISLRIAHGMGSGAIGELIEEFFGIAIPRQEIHVFKSLLARRYRSVSRRLIAKLTTGAVLHADETEVRLRSGKSYVWVFASLEEAVFVRRPTREGEFLRELLGKFAGVLITDFYVAYDGLECTQQKCLIHLIRDINQAVLDAPFDRELQMIAQGLGSLLRRIVSTIDDYGLKRRHLSPYRRDVEAFFSMLSVTAYRSETAQALQKRLIKYQNKLFAFLYQDGVPWNNSVAENAIKHFARYREQTVGLMTEAGLDDYLILLSVYVTCRYKGVSFLRFLLSRSRDIDAFSARPTRRARSAAIELYPQGFDSRGPLRRRNDAEQ
jgi:predicted RecB family nuclease